jgi:dienelactone hydrolase
MRRPLMRRPTLVLSTLLALAGCATFLPVSDLGDGQTGLIAFETVTPADREVLLGREGTTRANIWGELRVPSRAMPRMPAVVLIHGSSGVGTGMSWWTRDLNALGVATFVVDSFSGRGITETATDQSRLSFGAMIADAYRALALLATHPRIDRDRIALMGFSRGGIVALYASLERFRRAYGRDELRFAAHLPFYPACNIRLLEDEDVNDRPIRVFHGEADDWTPIEPCREYVDRLRAAGKNVQLFSYPGAYHAFDVPVLPESLYLPRVTTARGCRFEERERGVVVEQDSGQPADYTLPCFSRGATLGHHPTARAAAVRTVTAILRDVFRLEPADAGPNAVPERSR